MILLVLIVGLCLGFMLGRVFGKDDGFELGIKIARQWEGLARDWRMVYEAEMADTEHERLAIMEVRELERMHDGY